DPENYPQFEDIEVGGFVITLTTPAQVLIRAKQLDREITKDRKKREALAGVPPEKRYSSLRLFRGWNAFVGDLTTPVVSVAVLPKTHQTWTSALMNGATPPVFRFSADVRGVQVFRNDSLLTPLQGGHEAIRSESVTDVADVGYYSFDPAVLHPA